MSSKRTRARIAARAKASKQINLPPGVSLSLSYGPMRMNITEQEEERKAFADALPGSVLAQARQRRAFFDQLNKPDGVRLTKLKCTGTFLSLDGTRAQVRTSKEF